MNFQDKANDFAMGVGAYYVILLVVMSYPAFTVAYFLGCIFGIDTGVVVWMLGTLALGVMLHLQMIRPLVWIAVITIIPFFFIISLIFGR